LGGGAGGGWAPVGNGKKRGGGGGGGGWQGIACDVRGRGLLNRQTDRRTDITTGLHIVSFTFTGGGRKMNIYNNAHIYLLTILTAVCQRDQQIYTDLRNMLPIPALQRSLMSEPKHFATKILQKFTLKVVICRPVFHAGRRRHLFRRQQM